MTLVTRADADGIARLTLDNPAGLNALSTAMIDGLQAHLEDLTQDRSIRAVILAATGKAFCAGHDLREMQSARAADDGGAAAFKDLFDRCSRMMLSIRALPQPVIAQVQGVAVAAGCQLVATCDLALAADTARFGVNGINIGLFCSTPMVALTRAIPPKAAFDLLSTGRLIDAAEAQALGLINRAVPATDLTAATDALAQTLADKLPQAMALGKRAFHATTHLEAAAAYAMASATIVENALLEDTSAGMAAFLDRRAPKS